jgi:8-oxo-dGTP pyrophosphatase MutT (NUDIX family)
MIDLYRYKQTYPEELLMISRFEKFLQDPFAYDRSNVFGHVTASAFIINTDSTSLLLLHHKKLNMWLQPGGHADGETDVLQVAQKEAAEETGLVDLTLLSDGVGDLDVHIVPAFGNVREHFHFDIRFFFQAKSDEILKNEESHDVKWISLDKMQDFNNEKGTKRVLRKINCINEKLYMPDKNFT